MTGGQARVRGRFFFAILVVLSALLTRCTCSRGSPDSSSAIPGVGAAAARGALAEADRPATEGRSLEVDSPSGALEAGGTAGDLSAWVGEYSYGESRTGYGWDWAVRIARSEGGAFDCRLDCDGNQTAIRILCEGRVETPDRVGVYFVARDPDDPLHVLDAGPRVGDRLLGLERGDGGKARFLWDVQRPFIEPEVETQVRPMTLAEAETMVGKYPADFLRVVQIDRRLTELLGKKERKRLDDGISTQLPIAGKDGVLILEGSYPHMAGSIDARIYYDEARDTLHVLISDDVLEKRIDAFSEDWARAPKIFEEQVESEKQVRKGLRLVKHR
jgi:hypothetical protein